MKDDPVITRIRGVRRKISEAHGHDTERLIKHYQELQEKAERKYFEKEFKENQVV